MTVPLAVGCRLEPTPDLRTVDGGRILIGGAPLRILRLSDGGADLVRRWFGGEPVADRKAHHELARRLEHNGMANLRWPSPQPARDQAPDPDLGQGLQPVRARLDGPTVIIPTHDDQEELERTLAAGVTKWAGEVLIVDDGSAQPVETPGHGITVLRRDRAGGPGVARQHGLEACSGDLIIFLDAGVTLAPEAAEGLLAAFEDPAVVAAAPRVLSEPGDDLVARYEQRRSPLDLGPAESLVGPGRLVTYVPTACLAVRADAVAQAGGFDLDLRYGEDVDLVWRLGRIGTVRYLPHLQAWHRPRPTVPALLAQRRDYGSSAAGLAERHGADPLTPCRVSPWTALVVALAVAGRPGLAAVTAVGTGLALEPKLQPMPAARIEALTLTARGHWYGGLSILTASTRSWAPVLVALLAFGGRPRRLAGTVLAAATARRVLDGPRQPGPALLDVSLGLADDLAACTGLWQGALAHRSPAALRPVLASWPGGGPTGRERLAATIEGVRERLGRIGGPTGRRRS